MEALEALEINGKTYKPKPVTMRAWRELLAWDEKERKESPDLPTRMDGYLSIIALAYGLEPKELEDMEAENVIPVYRACAQHIFGAAFSRLEKLPNEEAAKEPRD